jgi:hypothetical protein
MQPATPLLFHGPLGGLWFDRTDAAALVDQRLARGRVSAGEAEQLRELCVRGYLVLEGAVAHPIVDQVRVDLERLWAKQDPRLMLELDRAMKHDRLGVNDAMVKIQIAWDNKRLVGTAQFLPLFDQVANNEALVHMARERAAQLAETIRALK